MLGHARLTQPELADKLSDRAGPLAQQVEDAAARRLSHYCKRRHGHHHTYQVIYLSRHVDLVTVLWGASPEPGGLEHQHATLTARNRPAGDGQSASSSNEHRP